MKASALALVAAVVSVLATSAPGAPEQQQFPQGRFSSPLTAADFVRYGGTMDPNFPHPWIITIRSGAWKTNEHPAFAGRYVVRGNRVTFVVRQPADAAGTRETLTWRYRDHRLHFRIVSGVGDDAAIYLAHPWRRIGA
jgi:hypothetical protein